MIKDLYCILILLLSCQQPFPAPFARACAHTCANLCSCAQLNSGSRKWEASLLWRKNRMHHFHLYGMAAWRSRSLAAETDLWAHNETGWLHDRWLFIDNGGTLCLSVVNRKMVWGLYKVTKRCLICNLRRVKSHPWSTGVFIRLPVHNVACWFASSCWEGEGFWSWASGLFQNSEIQHLEVWVVTQVSNGWSVSSAFAPTSVHPHTWLLSFSHTHNLKAIFSPN